MYGFIDESGDAGLTDKSSDYFIIALVMFSNIEDVLNATSVIKNFISMYKIPGEIKFSKTPDKNREFFFNHIINCTFKCNFLIVRKNDLINRPLIRGRFNHIYCFHEIINKNQDSCCGADIKIDEFGGNSNRQKIKTRVRQNLPTRGFLNKLSVVNSRNEVLIQLADMLAGAAHHYYLGKPDLYNFINRHGKIGNISFL